jgi:hypothetical protein
MTRHIWTDKESATLVALFPTHSARDIAKVLGLTLKQVYAKAQHLGLKKTAEWIRERSRQAMANPSHNGRKTQFNPGHSTWNKGISGYMGANATSFKTGSTRIADGYPQRKIADTGCTRRDFVPVHHLVWRLHGLAIPAGHALVFRDANRMNPDINNLELVTRADLMRRNSMHRWGREISQITQLKGAITRQINKRIKQQQEAQQ